MDLGAWHHCRQPAPRGEAQLWVTQWVNCAQQLGQWDAVAEYATRLATRVGYAGERLEVACAVVAQKALRDAGARRAVSDHPLSARLFIEHMLLDYSTLFR